MITVTICREKRGRMRRRQEVDSSGFIDISSMNAIKQHAYAKSSVQIDKELYENFQNGDLRHKHILENARFAGIMAAKNTSTLLPNNHPKELTYIAIQFNWEVNSGSWDLIIEVEAKAKHPLPIHTEAMAAASIAALTVYDLCQHDAQSIVLGPTYLSRKGNQRA